MGASPIGLPFPIGFAVPVGFPFSIGLGEALLAMGVKGRRTLFLFLPFFRAEVLASILIQTLLGFVFLGLLLDDLPLLGLLFQKLGQIVLGHDPIIDSVEQRGGDAHALLQLPREGPVIDFVEAAGGALVLEDADVDVQKPAELQSLLGSEVEVLGEVLPVFGDHPAIADFAGFPRRGEPSLHLRAEGDQIEIAVELLDQRVFACFAVVAAFLAQ